MLYEKKMFSQFLLLLHITHSVQLKPGYGKLFDSNLQCTPDIRVALRSDHIQTIN